VTLHKIVSGNGGTFQAFLNSYILQKQSYSQPKTCETHPYAQQLAQAAYLLPMSYKKPRSDKTTEKPIESLEFVKGCDDGE
jgi:hypothetical protein